jgi:ABC-2 type transport system permease protein
LVTALGTVASFFALSGKGYLAPLGFVAFVVVLGQIVTAVGYGPYFPWAIPALYSGAGGPDLRHLAPTSYAVVLMTGFIGYGASLFWWSKVDQK